MISEIATNPATDAQGANAVYATHPSFGEALKFWLKLGFISFGGPAGQISIMYQELVEKKPPPRIGRGELKFYYATQTAVRPPTFIVFANKPEKIHFSYKRFMTNQVRKQLHLDHTPIRLLFRKK